MKAAKTTDKTIVRNELLCYVFHYVNSSSAQSIIDTVCDFYKPLEIISARNILLDYAQTVLIDKLARKTGNPGDKVAVRPWAEDIVQWAVGVCNDTEKELEVDFCAIDLKNVPPCPPEKVDVFSLAVRVAALEEKLAQQATAKPVVSEDISWPKVGAGLSGIGRKAGQTPVIVQHPELQVKQSASGPFVAIQDQEVRAAAPAAPRASNWKKVQGEKKRRVREAARNVREVVGTASEDNSVRGSKAVKQVFVHKVDKATDSAAIKAYMNKRKVPVREIACLSKPEWFTNSFKIAVNEDDFEQVLSATFWPNGIRCREWVSKLPQLPWVPEPESDNDYDDVNGSGDESGSEHGED